MKEIEVDGVKQIVYSEEELKQQRDEAVAAALNPIQQQLKDTQDQLAKLSDKDTNFATLRTQVENLTNSLKDAEVRALDTFEKNGRTRTAERAILALADGDVELEKKIRHHYAKLSTDVKDEQGVGVAIREAFVLARQGEVGPDALAAAFGGGGMPPGQPPKGPNAAKDLTENQVKFLRIAYPGMTDEEIKKLNVDAKPPKVGPIDGNFNKITV